MSYALQNRVVLLNADNSVLHFISFGRAMNLFASGKISVLVQDEMAPLVHPRMGIKRPKVVALKRFAKVPFRRVRFNRKNLLLRDNYTCQYCSERLHASQATIDHVIPRSHKRFPGNGKWRNEVISCRDCNSRKDDRTPEQAGMKLLRQPFEPRLEDLLTNSGIADLLTQAMNDMAYGMA